MTNNRFPSRETFINAETGRYFPGFDARHVSVILTVLKDMKVEGRIRDEDAIDALATLQSSALQAKLTRAIEKVNGTSLSQDVFDEYPHLIEALVTTARASAARTPKPAEQVEDEVAAPSLAQSVIRTDDLPDVKIGRWFYPVHRLTFEDGSQRTERNANTSTKPLSDEWIEIADY